MAPAFALRRGRPAPQQSTPTTCGSICLVVARMLTDTAYAERVRRRGLAAEELTVRNRTNRLLATPTSWQVPWPRALGTPPWGAARELARLLGVGRRGVRWRVIRWAGRSARAELLRRWESSLASDGPVLLYVGSRWLPRHVTMLVPAADGVGVDVFEPSAGEVLELDLSAFVAGRLSLAGWSRPWLVVGRAPGPRADAAEWSVVDVGN
ncbi:hypothetical protein ACF3NS_14590 [Arsenicicoccus cauae]|uniref:Peptidase C39-like domain-containing protein n=1 Tax=Arsenicicoccus cauae TaxID=2663847 RepID=A0A6I3IEY2_9MICO|nr:hypothetical protein [Arsenicicoccus cauae]MTB71243.1 hypothetical protein [Arsenicicoccus cauae]